MADARMEISLTINRIDHLETGMLARLTKYGRDALGESALDEWMLQVIAHYGLLYVAMADGEIVGSAEVMRSMGDGDLYLEGFYIRPEYQRQGYGNEFLAGVMKSLADEDFDRLLVTLDPGNRAGHKLYGKARFREIGFLPDYYGAGRDRFLMAASLCRTPENKKSET